MSESLLRAENLSRSFQTGTRQVEVLRGIDLAVDPCESIAIVGESGVGKSTLLHLLGGLDRPDRGSIRFQDQDLFAGAPSLADYRNRHVGFIFQFHHLLPELNALENVEMPFRIARSREPYRAQATDILERIGLGDRLGHYPGMLSGGEQQRVAIARAVVKGPSLVLADEPTGNLDPRTGQQVFSLLAELQRERGFALVLATHNERLARACDRVVRMDEGTLRTLGADEARDYFDGLSTG